MTRRVLLAVHCVAGTLHPAASGAEPDGLAEAQLEAARLLAAERWDEAARSYLALVEGELPRPDLLSARLGIARAETGAKRFEAGLRELGEAVDLLESVAEEGRDSEWRAWRMALLHESGAICRAAGRWKDATEHFLGAAQLAGANGGSGLWRSRAQLDAAQALEHLGQSGRAIDLLTRSLEDLKEVRCAGLRALHKAALARLYLKTGERDWSVSLLEEIRNDPELDADQFEAAQALVQGERPGDGGEPGGLRTREGAGYLAIVSTGRFELRFARDTGLVGWFHLEADPFKTTNLVEPGGGSLLSLEARRGDGDGKGSVERSDRRLEGRGLKVIEDGAVRVRLREKRRAPVESTLDWTIYSTGRIHLLGRWRGGREGVAWQLGCRRELAWQMSLASGAWMPRSVEAVPRSRFVLLHAGQLPSSKPASPADLLVIPHTGLLEVVAPSVGGGQQSGWSLTGSDAVRTEGGWQAALQLQIFPAAMNAPESAWPIVRDYQLPAQCEVVDGARVSGGEGGLGREGYDEGEGCHVVEGATAVRFRAGPHTRHQPAIKFLGSAVRGMPDVYTAGRKVEANGYRLGRVGPDGFLLQWMSTVPAGGILEVSLR